MVAAPAWADPILRVHLGDLIPPEVAGRLDDERFGRIWEVSQRGARDPATARGAVVRERRFGALTLRQVERPPAVVDYDFVARWADARVSRRDAGGAVAPCRNVGDRIQCPDLTYNFVRRQIVEVDTKLREALLAQPVPGATVVVEFPAVRLGTGAGRRKRPAQRLDAQGGARAGRSSDRRGDAGAGTTVHDPQRRRLEADPHRHGGSECTGIDAGSSPRGVTAATCAPSTMTALSRRTMSPSKILSAATAW